MTFEAATQKAKALRDEAARVRVEIEDKESAIQLLEVQAVALEKLAADNAPAPEK